MAAWKTYGCGQKPWCGSFRAAARVIQTQWIRALIQALWIKRTSHLIQAPDINTSAWWRSTPPLSHQFTVKVVASTITAILFVASLLGRVGGNGRWFTFGLTRGLAD